MKSWIIIFGAIVFCFSCKKDNIESPSDICDRKLIIDNNLFDDAPADDFTFNSVEITGDCMKILFSYGGGCEDTKVKLIDSGLEGFSSPPTRFLRLSLDDDDNCEAWVAKEISFDLTPLRRGNSGSFILDLENWDESLTYKF